MIDISFEKLLNPQIMINGFKFIFIVKEEYIPDNITPVAHHWLPLTATGGPQVERPINSQ